MEKRKKVRTFIYEGLGFPIKLNGIPMKKVFGEWCLDINLQDLQRSVLQCLVYKRHPLTSAEIRFIRKYFEMTTSAFGKVFGVSHVTVLKWESGQNRVPSTTDFCIRLFVLDKLQAKNEEFGEFYHAVAVESLSKHRRKSEEPLLELNANLKFPSHRTRQSRC